MLLLGKQHFSSFANCLTNLKVQRKRNGKILKEVSFEALKPIASCSTFIYNKYKDCITMHEIPNNRLGVTSDFLFQMPKHAAILRTRFNFQVEYFFSRNFQNFFLFCESGKFSFERQ